LLTFPGAILPFGWPAKLSTALVLFPVSALSVVVGLKWVFAAADRKEALSNKIGKNTERPGTTKLQMG
jgi:hypothetical protein